MKRGEIYRVTPAGGGDPKRSRCYVILSRQTLIDSKADKVICAPINTTCIGLDTQVTVGVNEGLKHDSCLACDQLILVEKARLTNYVGHLSTKKLGEVRDSLRIALDVD